MILLIDVVSDEFGRNDSVVCMPHETASIFAKSHVIAVATIA